MLKDKLKIILITVLVIQLITPFTFLIYQANITKHLNDDTEYIKICIDSINYDSFDDGEININLNIDEIFYSDEYYENDYLLFETSENNEYSSVKFSKSIIKNNKHYINKNSFYKLEYLNYEYNDESLKNNSYLELYNKTNELENVANGYADGNLTEAYAILKIYKNHFKLEEIYVGGYTLKEFLNLYNQQKIDISRFKYYNHPTLKKSDYLKYIDEDKVFLYEDFLQYTDNSDGLYLTP